MLASSSFTASLFEGFGQRMTSSCCSTATAAAMWFRSLNAWKCTVMLLELASHLCYHSLITARRPRVVFVGFNCCTVNDECILVRMKCVDEDIVGNQFQFGELKFWFKNFTKSNKVGCKLSFKFLHKRTSLAHLRTFIYLVLYFWIHVYFSLL